MSQSALIIYVRDGKTSQSNPLAYATAELPNQTWSRHGKITNHNAKFKPIQSRYQRRKGALRRDYQYILELHWNWIYI